MRQAAFFKCTVALNRSGSSKFAFVTDETSADRAPSGLALLSGSIAFCYMTQLSRYIDAMKLAVRGVRLVQLSPYGIEDGSGGVSGPCDTHLFMQGEADGDIFERLQIVAANTCYLHQTMAHATPLHVTASVAGRQIIGE